MHPINPLLQKSCFMELIELPRYLGVYLLDVLVDLQHVSLLDSILSK